MDCMAKIQWFFAVCRLTCTEDKDYFKAMLYEMLKSKFEVREEYSAIFGSGNEIMFGAWAAWASCEAALV